MLLTFGLSPVAQEFCGTSVPGRAGSEFWPVAPEWPSTTMECGQCEVGELRSKVVDEFRLPELVADRAPTVAPARPAVATHAARLTSVASTAIPRSRRKWLCIRRDAGCAGTSADGSDVRSTEQTVTTTPS